MVDGELTRIASRYLEALDLAIVSASGALKSRGMEISCGPGCSSCCRLPVGATYPEGALVADFIKRHSSLGSMGEARDRLTAWAEWSRSGLVELLSEGIDPVRAYLYHGPGCPLLYERLCLVYPVRPAACRTHVSTGQPDDCMPPEEVLPVFFNPGSVREVNEAVRPVVENYVRELEAGGMDVSKPVEALPLIVMFYM